MLDTDVITLTGVPRQNIYAFNVYRTPSLIHNADAKLIDTDHDEKLKSEEKARADEAAKIEAEKQAVADKKAAAEEQAKVQAKAKAEREAKEEADAKAEQKAKEEEAKAEEEKAKAQESAKAEAALSKLQLARINMTNGTTESSTTMDDLMKLLEALQKSQLTSFAEVKASLKQIDEFDRQTILALAKAKK